MWFSRSKQSQKSRSISQNRSKFWGLFLKRKKETLPFKQISTKKIWGLSDSVMVLGKLSVPGHPTNLDYSRRAFYAGGGRLDIFFSLVYHFSLLSPSPSER